MRVRVRVVNATTDTPLAPARCYQPAVGLLDQRGTASSAQLAGAPTDHPGRETVERAGNGVFAGCRRLGRCTLVTGSRPPSLGADGKGAGAQRAADQGPVSQ